MKKEKWTLHEGEDYLEIYVENVPGVDKTVVIIRDPSDDDHRRAPLITAAPELLEELERDREMFIDLRDKHLNHTAAVVRALVQKRIESIEEKIVKARGLP